MYDKVVALAALKLAREMGTFIVRRRESLRFESIYSLQRVHEIDVDLARMPVEHIPIISGTLCVPLLIVERKTTTSPVILTGKDGRLPTLTRLEERQLLASGLTYLSREEPFRHEMSRVARAMSRRDLERRILEMINTDDEMPGCLGIRSRSSDFFGPYLSTLISAFATQRVVFGLLPQLDVDLRFTKVDQTASRVLFPFKKPHGMKSRPAGRSSLTLAYQEQIAPEVPGKSWGKLIHLGRTDMGPVLLGAAKSKHRSDEVRRNVLIAGTPGFPHASSYHLQVELPDRVIESSSELQVWYREDRSPVPKVGVLSHQGQAAEIRHYYLSEMLTTIPPDSTIELCQLKMVLRPSFHDGLRAARNIVFMGLAILLGYFVVLATVRAEIVPWRGLLNSRMEEVLLGPSLMSDAKPAPGQADRNSIVALILLVPAYALSLIIREKEGSMTKFVHYWVRRRLAIIAGGYLFSALIIAMALPSRIEAALLAGIIVALIPSSLMVASSANYSRKLFDG